MKTTFALVIVMVLCIHTLFAQKDFVKGYVLLTEKDTLFGLISNNSYFENSQFCEFKKSGSDNVTQYQPFQIYGFRFIDGKYYLSKKVIENNVPENVFVEFLIKGKLDVYFIKDQKDVNHFYVSRDGDLLTELKYEKGIREIKGTRYAYESRVHKEVLKVVLSDCKEIAPEIEKISEPDHNNMIKLARDYHKYTCNSGEECIVYAKKMPRKMYFNMVGGSNYFLVDKNDLFLSKNIYPSLGFNFLFQQPSVSERSFVGIGLVYEGFVRIPLSFNYIHSKIGFTPYGSIDVDLNTFATSFALKGGVNYNCKNVAFILYGSLKTITYRPYAAGINFSVLWNINKK